MKKNEAGSANKDQDRRSESSDPDRLLFQFENLDLAKYEDEDCDWSEPPNPCPVQGLLDPPAQAKVEAEKATIPDKRINYYVEPGEKLLECPYNKTHLILEKRMMNHLLKCQNQHLKEAEASGEELSIVPCSQNRSHHVHKWELAKHEEDCEPMINQPAWDPQSIFRGGSQGTAGPSRSPNPSKPGTAASQVDEDWDADLQVSEWANGKQATYDCFKEESKYRPYAQAPVGSTPSERRAHRNQQARLHELEEQKKLAEAKQREILPP